MAVCKTCNDEEEVVCPECNGRGQIDGLSCPECDGEKIIPCPDCFSRED